ncbi:MAG: cytochrome c biogenesis heme-transporting ATPase CcmA [Proteobacteria bacterium]|jgi:heme exporter protein A|nr:cytochrome c biogenesis heme-transporting ATPase CcmA [Pseudomonadota bacterium]MCG6936220.1 cytochrome c biogenesis heme-transporting ATPase CcmA [Pseudomonadota bacterium]
MLEVINLECTRGDRRLIHGLAFVLEAGELLHLNGHNGSGKTTLMRTICGLIAPTCGEVRWGGHNIREIRDTFNQELVYIGHKNALKADLTGTENLRLACQLDGLAVSDRLARDALERIGLRGHDDLPCRVLSQGQQRRVTLARLLLNPAPLWILDEPFTALDQAAVTLLQSVIQRHLDTGGMVVLTTHQEVALTRGEVKQLRLGWKRDGDV